MQKGINMAKKQNSDFSPEPTLGARLKQLRLDQKLTQQQLAKRLGVAKSVVSYYESGDRCPSYDVLLKIARLFHVTSDYLLGLDRTRLMNVSDLSEENIGVLMTVADALRTKSIASEET